MKKKQEKKESRGSLTRVLDLFLPDDQHRKPRGGPTQTHKHIFPSAVRFSLIQSCSKSTDLGEGGKKRSAALVVLVVPARGWGEKRGQRRGGVLPWSRGRARPRAAGHSHRGSTMEAGGVSTDAG